MSGFKSIKKATKKSMWHVTLLLYAKPVEGFESYVKNMYKKHLKKYADDLDVSELVDHVQNSMVKGTTLTFYVHKALYPDKKELLQKLKTNNMADGSWEVGYSTLWVIFEKGYKISEIDYDRKKIKVN